jgi:hypothetical protein
MSASQLALWSFVLLSVILLAFAFIVLGKIWKGVIKLDDLLSEETSSKASLSRFQFLIFTFVIAGLYLLLSIEAGTFVDIPVNVLALLGISGGSYVLSKSVSPGGALNPSATANPPKTPTTANPPTTSTTANQPTTPTPT